jgi:hypothetical protein
MKIQKILAGLQEDSRAFTIRQLIISRLDDIKEIKEGIEKNENNLFDEVKNILNQNDKLKEFGSFFNLIVSRHRDDPEYSGTLIDTICLLVSNSLSRLYDIPEENGNASINYAGTHYTISSSELFKNLQINPKEKLDNLFEKFNEVMKPYDIWIKQLNFACSEVSPLSIHIRILK